MRTVELDIEMQSLQQSLNSLPKLTTAGYCQYFRLKLGGFIPTSYAALSSGISWNIPRITCTFWYVYEPLGECVYQENTSDEWGIPRLYHEKGSYNYLIPCHRKYGGQMGRLGVLQLNCTDRWEDSVEY